MSRDVKWPRLEWPSVERSGVVQTIPGTPVRTPPVRVPSLGPFQMAGNDETRAPSDLLTLAVVVDVVDGVAIGAATFALDVLLFTRLAPPPGTATVATQFLEAFQSIGISRDRAFQAQIPVPLGDATLVVEVSQTGGVGHDVRALASFAVLSRAVHTPPCGCKGGA